MRRAFVPFVVAMLLIAGAATADTSVRQYTGHTSQGAVVTIVADAQRLGYHVTFRQSCESPSHKPLSTHTSGTFGVSRKVGVPVGPGGRFSRRYTQGRTKVMGVNQYFTAVYTLSGHVGKTGSSGTFRAVSKYYVPSGRELGTCDTGPLTWSAARKP